MSRVSTLHSSTRAAVAARLDNWSDQTHRLEALQRDLETKAEALRQTQAQTVEALAEALLPVATAMGRLTEETRRTLERIEESSREEREQMARRHAEQVAKSQAVTDRLATAMSQAENTIAALTAATHQANQERPSAWGPALVAAMLPLLAVMALAWKLGVLRL